MLYYFDFVYATHTKIFWILFYKLQPSERILILHPCIQEEPTLYNLFAQDDVSFVVTGSERVCPILQEENTTSVPGTTAFLTKEFVP